MESHIFLQLDAVSGKSPCAEKTTKAFQRYKAKGGLIKKEVTVENLRSLTKIIKEYSLSGSEKILFYDLKKKIVFKKDMVVIFFKKLGIQKVVTSQNKKIVIIPTDPL